jgi:uroporphyrinogen decarboxylase
MTTLRHRERVTKALNHEEPDRVPIDFGCIASGINSRAYIRLVKHLGLQGELSRPELSDPGLSVVPGEEVLKRFDVDTRLLRPLQPGQHYPGWERVDDRSYRDEWGVLWKRPEQGHYINVEGPFQRKEITLRDLERHRWPDADDAARVQGLREQAKRLHKETDYAIVLGLGNAVFSLCQRLRGFTQFLEDLMAEPTLAEGLMEQVTEVHTGMVRSALREAGPYVDAVFFADDMGFQDRPFLRPELYRRTVKKHHRRLVETIKSHTRAKVVMHNDGSLYALLPALIDTGIDALNPVQVSAKDMNTSRLKAEFGQRLCFWGGIDTHRVLPFQGPVEVVAEVQRRFHDLGPGGGWVLASVHTIQAEVPPENVLAMFEAAHNHAVYR